MAQRSTRVQSPWSALRGVTARRWGASALLTVTAVLTVGLAALSSAAQAGTLADAPRGLPVNVPPTRMMGAACSDGPAGACQTAVVTAIDHARKVEGVGPLVLPARYDDMSVPEQLLVLANAARVDRGLPGLTGLAKSLDGMAEQGAASNSDPNGPPDAEWGSNWAGGEASALLADYDWMYDDGPGSPNLDCTRASSSGCWGHRENILGSYGPHPRMGAAESFVGGVSSMTELFSSLPAGRSQATDLRRRDHEAGAWRTKPR
jgi:hypothetical protein